MTQSEEVAAAYSIQYLELSLTTTGMGTVAAVPSGPFHPAGTLVTVRATPAEEWSFASWSTAHLGTESDIVITMTSDLSLAAEFRRTTFYVSTSGDDANDGSKINPVASIGQALTNEAKEIRVSTGTYQIAEDYGLSIEGPVTLLGGYDQGFSERRFLTEIDRDNPEFSTVLAYSGEFLGNEYTYAEYSATVVLESAEIEGFTIRRDVPGSGTAGVMVNGAMSEIRHNTIRLPEVDGTPVGIMLNQSDRIVIDSNVIEGGGGGTRWQGVLGTCGNCTITNNQIRAGYATAYSSEALNIRGADTSVSIANNTLVAGTGAEVKDGSFLLIGNEINSENIGVISLVGRQPSSEIGFFLKTSESPPAPKP